MACEPGSYVSGVPVRISEAYRPPRKVTLPASCPHIVDTNLLTDEYEIQVEASAISWIEDYHHRKETLTKQRQENIKSYREKKEQLLEELNEKRRLEQERELARLDKLRLDEAERKRLALIEEERLEIERERAELERLSKEMIDRERHEMERLKSQREASEKAEKEVLKKKKDEQLRMEQINMARLSKDVSQKMENVGDKPLPVDTCEEVPQSSHVQSKFNKTDDITETEPLTEHQLKEHSNQSTSCAAQSSFDSDPVSPNVCNGPITACASSTTTCYVNIGPDNQSGTNLVCDSELTNAPPAATSISNSLFGHSENNPLLQPISSNCTQLQSTCNNVKNKTQQETACINYADFEAQNDPFDSAALKSINDMEELAQVLQSTQMHNSGNISNVNPGSQYQPMKSANNFSLYPNHFGQNSAGNVQLHPSYMNCYGINTSTASTSINNALNCSYPSNMGTSASQKVFQYSQNAAPISSAFSNFPFYSQSSTSASYMNNIIKTTTNTSNSTVNDPYHLYNNYGTSLVSTSHNNATAGVIQPTTVTSSIAHPINNQQQLLQPSSYQQQILPSDAAILRPDLEEFYSRYYGGGKTSRPSFQGGSGEPGLLRSSRSVPDLTVAVEDSEVRLRASRSVPDLTMAVEDSEVRLRSSRSVPDLTVAVEDSEVRLRSSRSMPDLTVAVEHSEVSSLSAQSGCGVGWSRSSHGGVKLPSFDHHHPPIHSSTIQRPNSTGPTITSQQHQFAVTDPRVISGSTDPRGLISNEALPASPPSNVTSNSKSTHFYHHHSTVLSPGSSTSIMNEFMIPSGHKNTLHGEHYGMISDVRSGVIPGGPKTCSSSSTPSENSSKTSKSTINSSRTYNSTGQSGRTNNSSVINPCLSTSTYLLSPTSSALQSSTGFAQSTDLPPSSASFPPQSSPGVFNHPDQSSRDQSSGTGQQCSRSNGSLTLPDPYHELDCEARGLVDSVAEMGFPRDRVARAVQRLGTQHKKLLEVLLELQLLEESGEEAARAEVAYYRHLGDADSTRRHLESARQY